MLPSLVTPRSLSNAAAVVIDLLRASTTITHALGAGAKCVVPVVDVDEARLHRGPGTVLGGERHGVIIPGFDLGNSPTDYTEASVGGKTVVFTTTNGTKAIHACARAQRVLIGCFANISAIEQELRNEETIHLVCAGTDNLPTLEDSLFAGALATRLLSHGGVLGNDQARLAVDAWSATTRTAEGVLLALYGSQGGRNLQSIGLERDIDECARIDTRPVTPRMKDGWLVLE